MRQRDGRLATDTKGHTRFGCELNLYLDRSAIGANSRGPEKVLCERSFLTVSSPNHKDFLETKMNFDPKIDSRIW